MVRPRNYPRAPAYVKIGGLHRDFLNIHAQRDGTFGIPIAPILDCERDLMLQKVTEFSRSNSTRSVNQHTSCDYETGMEP
jgi:hypothetical protein